MNAELAIQTQDGKTKNVPLSGERVSLGRSSTVELSFPDDSGLSRQHLTLERDGEGWTVQDLGSKNGTFLNSVPLKGKVRLKPGDRIGAGHLVITYKGVAQAAAAAAAAAGPVVFVESPETGAPSTSTFVTSLEGALSSHTMLHDAAGARGAKQMRALIRAGTELAGNRPLEELFPLILDLAIDAVGAQRGVVMTLEGGRLMPQANKGQGFRISTAVRDRVLENKCSVLVQDTSMDEALKARVSIVQQKVATLMAVPLQTLDRIIGLIYLDSPSYLRRFTEDDLSLLTVLANVAAIRIEHTRLAEIEQAERIMKRDLEQAAEIQQRLLPASAPTVAGADLAGYNAPCRTVGGDYYDFFTYPNGRVAMLLGDVSGKGMPASLLMMGLQARVQVLAEEPSDVGAFMSRLNKATCANCPSNRFITLFFCLFDPATGDVVYANAGHNPPFVVRAGGETTMLEGGGPVLGILPVAPYGQYRVRLERGDMLAVYSDGVTEATNAAGEEFGEERFAEVLAAHRGESSAAVAQAVTSALVAFVAGAPAADDITLVVAKRV